MKKISWNTRYLILGLPLLLLISGAGRQCSPNWEPPAAPVISLQTPSPGLDQTILISGSAPSASTVALYLNADCSGLPQRELPAAELSDPGASLAVPPDATTKVSARSMLDRANFSDCSNVVTYVQHGNRYWQLTFADEFQGPQPGDDPACYSMPPQCIGEYQSGLFECPEQPQGLAALNKCNWTVLRQNNWMAMDFGPDSNGVNAFLPQEVEVKPEQDDGVLILTAHGYLWDGRPMPDPNSPEGAELAAIFGQPQAEWLKKYDCRWNGNTIKCPILSGAVYNKQFDFFMADGNSNAAERGFIQEYGRWEIRAKLPYGTGSFPAHWLLPQNGSWPERGEIDIMEAGKEADLAYQTYHTGYCEGASNPFQDDHRDCQALKDSGARRFHLARGSQVKERLADEFIKNYHVFAVEWSPTELRFLVDDVLSLTIPKNSPAYGSLTDYQGRATGQARPMNIPHGDFFLILNQTVHNGWSGDEVNPYDFATQQHIIDYVRTYERCTTPTDFCQEGFMFDGSSGLCSPSEGNTSPAYPSPCQHKAAGDKPDSPQNSQFDPCTDPCPYGGYFDGSNCNVVTVPQPPQPIGQAGEAFLYTPSGGTTGMYYKAYPIDQCSEQLRGPSGMIESVPIGLFDGSNCFLDPTLPGVEYFVYGSPESFPTTHYYGALCHHRNVGR
jgi:beta-glucanase (GH16 family)